MRKQRLSWVLALALCLGLCPWLSARASAAAPSNAVSFASDMEMPASPGFVDVPESQYYFMPVAWAVEQGITDGTSPTTFSPDRPCTKGEILTFLWRAVGSPEPDLPEVNPFPLASENAYYYKPLLWALSTGALYDTVDFDFDQVDPNAPCTRLTAVYYLWMVLGYVPENLELPFTDVEPSLHATAVAWALDAYITEGTAPTTFSPDKVCTRGEIVTFLFRAMFL